VDSCKAELEAYRFLCTSESLYTLNGDSCFDLITTSLMQQI
jgi:hypothetical protein